MIDQRFELRSPVPQVLDLVEEQEGRFAVMGGLIEGLAQDGLLVPIDEAEDRLRHLLKTRQLIRLDPEDVFRRHSPLQEIVQDLQLSCRLPDLARASNHDHGREPKVQPAIREYLTKLREDAYIELRPGYVDLAAAPGKDTSWSDPAKLAPVTTTKEEVLNKKKKRRLLWVIPLPGGGDKEADKAPETSDGTADTTAEAGEAATPSPAVP